jgi:hypothetical protein
VSIGAGWVSRSVAGAGLGAAGRGRGASGRGEGAGPGRGPSGPGGGSGRAGWGGELGVGAGGPAHGRDLDAGERSRHGRRLLSLGLHLEPGGADGGARRSTIISSSTPSTRATGGMAATPRAAQIGSAWATLSTKLTAAAPASSSFGLGHQTSHQAGASWWW